MKHFSCLVSLPALMVAGLAAVLAPAPAAAEPQTAPAARPASAQPAKPGKPTPEEARKFLAETSARLKDLTVAAGRAEWVQQNFITEDTELMFAARQEELLGASIAAAKEARRFDGVELPADQRRQLELLKQGGLSIPAPRDPAKTAEVSRLAASLSSQYGAGKYCRPGGECLDLEQLSDIIEQSRDPKELLEAWTGWHSISPPMRGDYQRLVELANEGARELGYKDVGALWRSKYDMPPDAFAAELDRLWGQVKPLYDSLHCHVRAKLNEKYGDQVVPLDKPIPAHLLGNMWAQSWDNLYDLAAPPKADPGYDLTERLKARNMTPVEMVKTGEAFFSSLGFAPLPETFWKRSLFEQPKDHEVVCHASAWNIDYQDDLRIKMCIQVNTEDFATIHHELGHNYYQRAYNKLPFLYQTGANDGFHEAVGDAVALSITPDYLKQIGLIEQVPDPSKDLGLLMDSALAKVAFLPFGLLIDQWRWKVFSGEIPPASTRAWRRRWRARSRTSTPGPSTTCRATRPTPATSSPTSCSTSSTARSARRRGRAARSTAARSTATRRRASACRSCWPWERASPGRRLSRRRPARSRWTPPPSSTTTRRSRPGSTSRTAAGEGRGEGDQASAGTARAPRSPRSLISAETTR
jgi:peptidyl-dipeptidase A